MMLLIEYITILTQGQWSKPLKKSGFLQILVAALLGLVPGCLGTYTAVTLYSHGVFSFAAIVTAMIATSGDEAFVMFGGKYVIKFSGDLDSNIKLSINDFFDGLLELESKIDYIYDNRNLVIEIDPFVRKNFMTLSWKLVPFEI